MSNQEIDSELLERKFKKRFSQLDTDGDGFLEHRYGESADSDRGQAVMRAHERLWAAQAAAADINIDGRVSFEEYTLHLTSDEFRNGMLNAGSGISNDYWFAVCDADGDGFITRAEFRMRPTTTKLREDEADEIFRCLDTDCDGLLNREEAQQAVRDFFTSSDPQAPGNLFFGQY